jgi:hypothetical protein
MSDMRFCYVCNQPMLEAWVCWRCCTENLSKVLSTVKAYQAMHGHHDTWIPYRSSPTDSFYGWKDDYPEDMIMDEGL